jgi:cytidyltransferase-like protein
MKELIRKLYILQTRNNGIPETEYSRLEISEQEMLELREGKYFLKTEHRKQLTVVLTGGVFDILHIGHVYTLSEAKKLGDVLVVVLAKDEHIKNKNRNVIHSQEYRTKMVEFLKPVDIAIIGIDERKEMIKLVEPDVIVYGYDQREFLKPEGVEIVKLKEHVEEEKFKTSKIIKELGL